MRFYFFIQSFAQLEQVYGKETASIIQDNSALIYLKTNSVECAEVIAKKLGRATVITNSLSKSTDPFKVGANRTESLMGRELMTANEIIGLKYKTIIFPIFSNPIFRDTYLYSDIYPQYKNYPVHEREIKILKRLTKNYYTVEKMKDLYDKKNTISSDILTKQTIRDYQRNTTRQVNQVLKNIKKENINHKNDKENLDWYINEIKNILNEKIISELITSEGIIMLEMNVLINKFEIAKLKRIKDDNVILEIASNRKNRKTIIFIWKNELEVG